jgi:hypothetical protein
MEEPPIRQAINYTLDTLADRGSLYRNLVMLVSLTVALALLLTIVLFSPRWLLLLGCLLPLVHGWLWLDERRMRIWRNRIMEICHAGNLDVKVFSSTIGQLRHLPQGSIQAMLDLLATVADETGQNKQHSIRIARATHLERVNLASLLVSGIGMVAVVVGNQINGWILSAGILTIVLGKVIATALLTPWQVESGNAIGKS